MTSRKSEITTRREPESKTAEARMRPFTSVLYVGLFIVPGFVLLLRVITAADPTVRWLAQWLPLLLFGVFGVLAAIGVGYKVAERRLPFVVWHVAATVELFAVAVSWGVAVGWDRPNTDPWWWRQVDAVTVPTATLVIYLFGAVTLCGSWLLYRINAFRSATNSGGDGSGDSWSELLKGATVRRGSVRDDGHAIEATIDHQGIPVNDLRAKIPALEENPGVIRGRTTIVGADRGGVSKLRLVHTDPHTTWKVWPGPSFPGGSYSWPMRTSYYSDGQVQWYSFCRTPEGFRSELCPGFASPNDTFKGSQGMTGSGKSGEAAIELAEVLTRRNVVVGYVDLAKLIQNAGWCLDFVTFAAANRTQSRMFWRGVRRLGEYRTKLLGAHRNFTDATYDELGLPWVHIFADEFDIVSNSADVKWMATKGRSLGFRLSLTLPRATASGMDADVRGAVGMWTQFGISQDYDKGFVLSQETMDAGANPENFGARVPGLHYLDQAPGIDPSRYPIDCRSYKTRDDYGDLRRAVEAARATFTPATLTPGEIEALGDAWSFCQPSVVRNGAVGMVDDDPPPAAAGPTPIEAAAAVTAAGIDLGFTPEEQATLARAREIEAQRAARRTRQQEGPTRMPTIEYDTDTNGHPDTGDDDLDELIAESNAAADLSEFRDADGNLPQVDDPLPDYTNGGDIDDLPTAKPVPRDRAHAVAEFDAALVRMAQRGVTEFRNADLIAEMTVDPDESMISKRFTALCDDDTLTPPGIVIERVGKGRFLLTRVDGGARPAHGA